MKPQNTDQDFLIAPHSLAKHFKCDLMLKPIQYIISPDLHCQLQARHHHYASVLQLRGVARNWLRQWF